jgi:ribosomal protein L17
MRHRKRTAKLGMKSQHRRATLANLVCSLIEHSRIRTTIAKAKVARRYADKMITLAKRAPCITAARPSLFCVISLLSRSFLRNLESSTAIVTVATHASCASASGWVMRRRSKLPRPKRLLPRKGRKKAQQSLRTVHATISTGAASSFKEAVVVFRCHATVGQMCLLSCSSLVW